jgi:hypothetical protein
MALGGSNTHLHYNKSGDDSPVPEDRSTPAENSGYGLLVSALPSVEVKKSDLERMTVRERAWHIAKEVTASSSTGLIRGAVLRQMVDFLATSIFGIRSSSGKAYVSALKSVIDVFTIDATIRGLLVVRDDENEDQVQSQRMVTDISRYLTVRWGLSNSTYPITNSFYSGYFRAGDGLVVDMKQLMETLLDLDKSVAAAYDVTISMTEKFNHDDMDFMFAICRVAGMDTAIVSVAPTDSVWDTGRQSYIFGPYGQNHDEVRTMRILDAAVKENFIVKVNPERNVIQLSDLYSRNCMVAVPRRVTNKAIYNLNVDDIAVSIGYAIEHKTRHVIALVGDPGLGKTEAVHYLVNQFPKQPALFVTSAALGAEPDAETVQTIFRIAAATRSILILEDFDGHNVRKKSPYVVELLRQLSGEGDFHGVALVTINEPQSVANTLLNRPGRIDEVHVIQYLDVGQVQALLNDVYQVKLRVTDVRRMVLLRFSTARIRSAIDRAIVRKYILGNGKVVDKAGVRQCIEDAYSYERNANLVSVRGRLVETDAAPVVEDEDAQDLED